MTDGGAPRAAPRRPSAALLLFDLAAIAVFGVAVFFTWRRLFVGMDLQDESFYILVPWRWALGDTPFVHEQNLAQVSGLLTYPLVKLFGVVRGYDVTGLVLYTRHLYMLLTVFTAGVVFLVARLVLRWQLALLVAAVFVTYIFWQTPQLSYNTMGALFLTLGTTLGLRSVLGGGSRLWAALAGAACGLAVVAYPTLVFIMPFYGVLLAFSLGRRAVGAVADLRFALPPGQGGEPTGRIAWRAVSFWVLGGVLVLVPAALVVLSFGLGNLRRSWAYSMEVAREGGQLGGATKAVAVVQGFWRFFAERPFVLLGALLVLLVYMRWPRTGRLLLALLPCALWLAGQHALLNASGFVIACAFLTPYLYLFVPRERKELGAKLLIWVWAPSMIAGAMTAFTSAAGYVNAAVGLLPTLLASGVFLAWSLEATARPEAATATVPEPPERSRKVGGAGAVPLRRSSVLALVVLAAVVGVTVAFQFQFQQRDVPYSALTKRFDFGPWYGIAVTPARYDQLRQFSADLRREGRPTDQLLVFYQTCGYYLFWRGGIAANSYWIGAPSDTAPLPQSTVSYYRRERIVPTLVVHVMPTGGMSAAQLTAACGGLDYPPTLVRSFYAFQRRPPGLTTREVLAGLPRE